MRANTIQDILLRLVICKPKALETGCWEYPGRAPDKYRMAGLGGKHRPVHRIVYEHFVGAIPEGKELHHRCENKPCANYEHLAPLTDMEHVHISKGICARNAAKTHCQNGHLLPPAQPGVKRRCHECRQEYAREWARVDRRKRDRVEGSWQAQKTHCPHGHEYTPENTMRDAKGYRYCRECRRDRYR